LNTDQLKALRDLFVENEEQILEALAQDLGRCRMESVLSEISTTVAEIDLALRNLKTWAHPQRVSTPLAQMKGLSHSEIHKQPLGTLASQRERNLESGAHQRVCCVCRVCCACRVCRVVMMCS
jgi:acyl-CoA reductase-like NAD-dependent aldehyde dehydrogenase